MTTPASGQISLSQVRTTLGASGQVSFSDFYAGGTYLPSTVSSGGGSVPTSGQISLSDFYSPLVPTIEMTPTGVGVIVSDANDWTSPLNIVDQDTATKADMNEVYVPDGSDILGFHSLTNREWLNTFSPTTFTNIKMEVLMDFNNSSSGFGNRLYGRCHYAGAAGTGSVFDPVPPGTTNKSWKLICDGTPAAIDLTNAEALQAFTATSTSGNNCPAIYITTQSGGSFTFDPYVYQVNFTVSFEIP